MNNNKELAKQLIESSDDGFTKLLKPMINQNKVVWGETRVRLKDGSTGTLHKYRRDLQTSDYNKSRSLYLVDDTWVPVDMIDAVQYK